MHNIILDFKGVSLEPFSLLQPAFFAAMVGITAMGEVAGPFVIWDAICEIR